MFVNIAFIFIGIFLLLKGANFLVDGASNIAHKFKISEIVIGLTIVSIGTSLPELIVSLTSSLKNYSDITIGNVIGSNISNLFLILGICSIIRPLKFKDKTIKIEIPLVIFLTALFFILANNGNQKIISRFEGSILLIFCILFILYNIIVTKKSIKSNLYKKDREIALENVLLKSSLKIIIGIVLLKYGGDFTVDNISELAIKLGISGKIVSITILSFSTSLPELITSIVAVLKKEIDMAIGNIMGSNVFNIVLIIGVTAIIKPIEYLTAYNNDIIVFLIGMIVLLLIPYINKNKQITKLAGIGYVASYLIYIIGLVYINVW